MKYVNEEYLTLKLPPNVAAEQVVFKRYRKQGRECTAVEIDGITYRVVARESSGVQLLHHKEQNTVAPISLALECERISVSPKELAQRLPQVGLEQLNNQQAYLASQALAETFPLSGAEWALISKDAGLLRLEVAGENYLGVPAPDLVRDSLLLLRSIYLSSCADEPPAPPAKQAFCQFFPEPAFQIVERYTKEGRIEIHQVEQALQDLGVPLE